MRAIPKGVPSPAWRLVCRKLATPSPKAKIPPRGCTTRLRNALAPAVGEVATGTGVGVVGVILTVLPPG